MTYRCDVGINRASLTPEAVRELLTMLTRTQNPLADLLAVVLRAAMNLEPEHHLHEEPHERTDIRYSYVHGYKERTLKTRRGTIALSIP